MVWSPDVVRWFSAVVVVLMAASAPAEDWPMLGRDATRNSVSSERGGPTEWNLGKRDRKTGEWSGGKNLLWTAKLGSLTFGDPVVAGGRIWIGTNNSCGVANEPDASVLAGFAIANGKPVYRYLSPRLASGRVHDWPCSAMAGSPLIEGDRLWFVTNRAEVICWDTKALKEGQDAPATVWKIDMMKEFGVSPCGSRMCLCHFCSIAAHKDLIYVITGNGVDETWNAIPAPDAPSLICLDKHTGKTVWQDKTPGKNILSGQWASPLVIEVAGKPQVVVPQGDGWLRAFEALSGKMIWEFDINFKAAEFSFHGRGTKNMFFAPPVFHGGRVYIASGDHAEHGEGPGRLVCIDPTKTGDISTELAVDKEGAPLARRRLQSVVAAQGEKAIPNPNSGLVWQYTSSDRNGDGKPDFEEQIYRSQSSVAIKDGLLIACDYAGLVHCLDASTGKEHWSYDMLAAIYAPPLIVEDKVYVGDEDGDLAVFRLSGIPQQEPFYQPNFGCGIYTAPIFAGGVLYVANRDTLFAIAQTDPEKTTKTEGFWPQWRGPLRDNRSTDQGLLQDWPTEGPPLVWRADGLGSGFASLSLAGGKIYTLSYFEGGEYVVALSEQTGERLWRRRIGPETPMMELMRWLSQRSPTLDGDRLYATTADGICVCLQTATGEELWRVSYPEVFDSKKPTWGFCDYPLVDGDRLIIAPGGEKASLAALDKRTGKILWQTLIPDAGRSAYAATVVAEIEGVPQYLSFLGKGLVSVRAADGKFLWRYDGNVQGTANSYTPLVRGKMVYHLNGYGGGLAGLRVTTDAKEAFAAEEVYFTKGSFDAFEDATVIVEDRLFTFISAGIPTCMDLKDGSVRWRTRVAGKGKAALTYADGRLYTLHADGSAALLEPSPEAYAERGRFQLPDHKPSIGATFPVVTAGRLYLRDNDRLYSFSVRRGEAPPPPRIIQLPSLGEPKAVGNPPPPGERAPRAVFVPTPHDVVEKMLALAQVQKADTLADLGSGDGRIVIAAAKQHGCKAVGYELDPELVESSRALAAKAGVEQLVTFERKDLFQADLAGVQVVTLYLLPKQLETLLPKLRQMKPGARIVTHQFPLHGRDGKPLEPDEKLVVESKDDGDTHTIYLWKTPLKEATK